MLTYKQTLNQLEKRFGTADVWFIDRPWNCDLEDCLPQEIYDLYSKKTGQYKNCKIFVAKDLRHSTYGNLMIIVTRQDFTEQTYFEYQWDPKFNANGFKDGLQLNSYKDKGDLIRINEDTVIEEIDGSYFIMENYHEESYQEIA